jgi:hypothetical protein
VGATEHSDKATATSRRLELAATVLLAFATVATAWSAYQARVWTGEQSQGYSHATASRIAVNRAAALANRQVQIDVATFVQWVDAHAARRTELADFYRARFRSEFRPAFAAWIATRPFESANAPPTPFALPQYRLKASEEAERLEATAAAAADRAKDANQRADNYMLALVLFASSLFFAGLSTKLQSRLATTMSLCLGAAVFLVGLLWIATMPIQVST